MAKPSARLDCGRRDAPDSPQPRPQDSGPSAQPIVDQQSGGVRPFTNLRGDKPQEYFSDGLTEEVRGAPQRERDLIGPGNTALFSFTGRTVAAAERDLLSFPTEKPQELSIGAALNRWVALGRDETALRLPRPDGCSDCAAAGIRDRRAPVAHEPPRRPRVHADSERPALTGTEAATSSVGQSAAGPARSLSETGQGVVPRSVSAAKIRRRGPASGQGRRYRGATLDAPRPPPRRALQGQGMPLQPDAKSAMVSRARLFLCCPRTCSNLAPTPKSATSSPTSAPPRTCRCPNPDRRAPPKRRRPRQRDLRAPNADSLGEYAYRPPLFRPKSPPIQDGENQTNPARHPTVVLRLAPTGRSQHRCRDRRGQ